MADDQDRVLTLEQIAERTGLPLNTLRYYRVRGEGPKTFRLGRRVVGMSSDVEHWIAAAREKEASLR